MRLCGTDPFTYTAIAQDSYGRKDTNIITVDIESSNSVAYDLNGNMLTNGTRVFEYDDENQLTRITQPNTWKSEFSYDGRMRRRIRKEYAWNGAWLQTNEVRYVYDGNLVIQERDGNNLPQVTYTRGNDLSGGLQGAGGIGGLLARTANPATLNSQLSTFAHAFYHADGNGNITCLIYTNQTVAAKYEYDSFGNILSQSGPISEINALRFSGKEYHAPSGLVYYLYRYYDPNLQKWINRDPIAESGGVNLYEYVANNPVSKIDPVGFGTIMLPRGTHTPPPPPGYGWRHCGNIGSMQLWCTVDLKAQKRQERKEVCQAFWRNGGREFVVTVITLPLGGEGAFEEFAEREMAERTPFVPEEYWQSLTERAPVQSGPYDVIIKYGEQGEIRGATTYDEFGNRTYQYEFGSDIRHGEGYHIYDNSTTGGFGDGPRSPHIIY